MLAEAKAAGSDVTTGMRRTRIGRIALGRLGFRLFARLSLVLVVALVVTIAADAARLPGVKTPTRNISCFYVPIKPTTHGNLLCDIHKAAYLRALQNRCMATAGLDWHGFSLAWNRKGQVVCSGGVLYDIGRDTPTYTVLPYGKTWRYRTFSCMSRATGLTCTNGRGHGLFLSRESWRTW